MLAEERTTEADRVKIMEARKKSAEKMRKMSTKINKNDSVETNSLEEDGNSLQFERKYWVTLNNSSRL